MNNTPEFSAPHIRSGTNELSVALDLAFAAAPAIIWSAICYGARPILVIIISMLVAALIETLCGLVLKKTARIPTASALGMIVALFLPAGVNYAYAGLAALIAVILRRFIGGSVNPIAGAILPLFFLSESMASHSPVFEILKVGTLAVDGSSENLLYELGTGYVSDKYDLLNVILGKFPESIGGMSFLLLTVGCIYLLIRRTISWHIPVGYLAGSFAIWYFFIFDGAHYAYYFYHLASGGAMLCAVFGAAEFSSLPLTSSGRFIHGLGCGVLTMLFRQFGYAEESVLLSLLIMSLFSRIIDMLTAERYFGYNGKKLIERLSTLIPFYGNKK